MADFGIVTDGHGTYHGGEGGLNGRGVWWLSSCVRSKGELWIEIERMSGYEMMGKHMIIW